MFSEHVILFELLFENEVSQCVHINVLYNVCNNASMRLFDDLFCVHYNGLQCFVNDFNSCFK